MRLLLVMFSLLSACDVDLVILPDMREPAVPPGSKVVFTKVPSTAVAGASFEVEVSIIKPNGQVAQDAAVDVTLSIGLDPGGGTLADRSAPDLAGADLDTNPGQVTKTTSHGVANFPTLWLDKIGNDYALLATVDGFLVPVQSGLFNITAAAATKLIVSAQPFDATVGNVLTGVDAVSMARVPYITVDVRDFYDNVLPDGTQNVSVALEDNPSGATLSGTLTVAAEMGVARFTDLRLDRNGADYTLVFTSAPLTTTRSGRFSIILPWNTASAGIFGGNVTALTAAAPTGTFYAATVGGVYKTTTAGAAWVNSSSGISTGGMNVRAVIADAATPTTLYAATAAGLYKSSDSAVSWTETSSGISNRDCFGVAVAGSSVYVSTSGGVFHSTNAGVSFTLASSGISDLNTRAIVVAPSSPGTIYVGTKSAGVFKSSDSAASWTGISSGLTNLNIAAIAVDKTNVNNVLVGTASGVARSTDGTTFAPLSITSPTHALWFDPAVTANAYAATDQGIWKSTNSGASFATTNTGLPPQAVTAVASDITATASVMVAADGAGVFHSSDGATTWTSSTAGITQVAVYDFLIDPSDSAIIYVATFGAGVFRSINSGQLWAPVNSGLPRLQTRAFTVDRTTSPTTILVGTAGDGVYKSTMNGTAWVASSSGLGALDVLSLAADPLTSQTMFAATAANGLFRSANGGLLWASVTGIAPTTINWVAVDPIAPENVIIATDSGAFRSTDHGLTFAQPVIGLAGAVRQIDYSPLTHTLLFAATSTGIYRSFDSGATFTQVGVGITNVFAISADPSNVDDVYAGTALGAYRSPTRGANWETATIGLPLGFVRMIRPDLSSSATIFASVGSLDSPTIGFSLWRSLVGGAL